MQSRYASDIFAPKWRSELETVLQKLLAETERCVRQQLQILGTLNDHIRQLEDRFPAANQFASYCGLVPKISASLSWRTVQGAGRPHYGCMVKQCNTYLKWAFIACPGRQAREAANVIVRHRQAPNWRGKYVVHLYDRTRRRKGHSVAVGAVARYLAESTYWVLKKSEPYREPPYWTPAGKNSPLSLSQGQARA